MKLVFILISGMLFYSCCFSQIQTSGSYLNVSKPSGGTTSSGDVLEIRAVLGVPSGTTLNSISYTDVVPAGTTYVAGSLKTVTNEGLVVSGITNTGNFTDATDGDRAQISGTSITFNIGTGATASAGGSIIGGSTTPVFQTNATILMVAFQIRIGTASGVLLGGTFHYKVGSGSLQNTTLTANTLVVSAQYRCNSLVATNLLTAETGGSFGSGTSQNRASSSNVTGYAYISLSASSSPGDGQYIIVKNSSPKQYTGSSPTTADMVWGVWDIIGDHTGAATAAGNPPAANGVSAGYMLGVNATYAPAVVFNTTLTGLVPSGTYTVSFWVRNICPLCGNNPSNGTSNGTPGVKPNLSINLSGKDWYSTGEVTYTGQWEQRSFTFTNGPSTSPVLQIKNNAPGGGGNDWAIDDITVNQCLIILPVKMESFGVTPGTKTNLLSWKLASGDGIQYFEIQRSTDGVSFASVGQEGDSPDGDGTHYFTDDHLPPSPNRLFYRLRIADRDGQSTYSNIITVNEGDTQGLINTGFAPNPVRAGANATLYLWTDVPGTAQIGLFTQAGALVLSLNPVLSKGQNSLNISLPSRLSPGIYIVRATAGGRNSYVKLIIE